MAQHLKHLLEGKGTRVWIPESTEMPGGHGSLLIILALEGWDIWSSRLVRLALLVSSEFY